MWTFINLPHKKVKKIWFYLRIPAGRFAFILLTAKVAKEFAKNAKIEFMNYSGEVELIKQHYEKEKKGREETKSCQEKVGRESRSGN